jgi:hypothetical protein
VGYAGAALFNGAPPDGALRCRIGYILQTDYLLPFLTVRETLGFAARLRLPSHRSAADKRAVVEARGAWRARCAAALAACSWLARAPTPGRCRARLRPSTCVGPWAHADPRCVAVAGAHPRAGPQGLRGHAVRRRARARHQRRRGAACVNRSELVTDPALLFCDEPTTGTLRCVCAACAPAG